MQLFGRPEAVTADVRIEREGGLADDAFDILLHYPHSLRAALRSSILAAAPRPRFVLFGDARRFRQDTPSIRRKTICAAATFRKTRPWGAEPEENWGVLT